MFNCQDSPSHGRQKVSLHDFMLADPRLWLVGAAPSLLLVQRTGLPGVVGRMQWGQAMAVGLSSVTTTGRQSGQSSRELEFEHSPVPAWDSRAASQCPRLEHHGFAAELC